MDQADIADQIITEYLEKAVAAARGIQPAGACPSATHCIDCGDQIPEKRRSAIIGCKRCVSCAEDFEKRHIKSADISNPVCGDDRLIDDILLADSVQ